VALALVGCSGTIGSDSDDPPPTPGEDMGPPGFAECGEAGAAILFFERSCAGCHQGSRYPDLSREGLARLSELESRVLPGQPLLVPGDPEGSFLYRKMAHTQGEDGGANMPLGRATPVSELGLIEDWIRSGASTSCDELDPPVVDYDPNTLDPDELFTCADPSAPRASPSRLRRVERAELTQVALGGYNNSPKIQNNPLSAPEGLAYSTYAEGVGMDPATLNLLMLHLPEASLIWSDGDPHGYGAARPLGVYRTDIVGCMEADAPDDACIDRYIDTMLRRGVLFRAPTDGERERLRAYVDARLADEPADGERQETLHEIAQAAMLMTGALFRSDVGDPATMEGTVRELSDTELAYALGSVISTAPVGVPVRDPITSSVSPDDPDSDDLNAGRLGLIAAAAADGTIRDAAKRRELLRHYAGGISTDRPDLAIPRQQATNGRGAYWLAPRLRDFFREWLGYGDASNKFKDHPAETSAIDSDGGQYDTAVIGYASLQTSLNAREASLVQQLDAVIARAVLETDSSGDDFFERLLTTREWLLPANLSVTGETPCTDASDCSGSQVCPSEVGRCSGNTWRSYFGSTWAYGWTDPIEDDDAERWVTVPALRIGVLTHPAWLTAHGGNFEDDASLVLRGHWVRTQLFCQSFGDLSDVQGLQAMLVPSDPDLSARQRVRRSTEPGVDPEGDDEVTAQCFGCHSYMNSLGFPFELFNHAGFERAEDHGGAPDGSTVIDNAPDDALNAAFAGPEEFIRALASSAFARRGMVRHAFRFFMGRDEVLADGCTLLEMEEALESTGSFLAMLEALISSETFVRRDLGGEP
jgi:hypothetical protein